MKRIFLILILVAVFSSLLIISNHNLYIFEEGGVSSFTSIYFSWLAQIYINTISFTGNVIQMDWFPENITKK